jgi:CheY-like chemotaxis protein
VTAKRALIVDDSKSARVVLSRMLEEYAIEVDTAESAEDAIEYLKNQRPDVIFMDHLMPGMDGFQAVQAIKNDPRTAAIPIMMYTSQQGELYMGQARALGALGVLPKQVAPTDVSKVLYQLHLLPERRDGRPAAFQPVLSAAEQQRAAAQSAPLPAGRAREIELQAAVEPLLKAQSTELRRFVVASLDSFAARVLGEVRQSLNATPVSDLAPPPHPPPKPLGWILFGALAAVALFVTLAVAWRQSQELDQVTARLASAERATADAQAAARAAAAAAAPAASARAPAPADGAAPVPAPGAAAPSAAPGAAPSAAAPTAAAEERPQSLSVPYGEVPLSGARLDAIKTWVADLEHKNAAGTLRVTSYTGDFCLTGNPAEGYSLAPEDLPAKSCDLTGNPYDDAQTGAQRESRPLADLQAAIAAGSKGALAIASVQGGRSKQTAYPQSADATAAQWNTAAAANQRVDISFLPRAAVP